MLFFLININCYALEGTQVISDDTPQEKNTNLIYPEKSLEGKVVIPTKLIKSPQLNEDEKTNQDSNQIQEEPNEDITEKRIQNLERNEKMLFSGMIIDLFLIFVLGYFIIKSGKNSKKID